jgi:hypothetical protein
VILFPLHLFTRLNCCKLFLLIKKSKKMKGQAILKWARLTVSAKVIKARAVTGAMGGSPNFAAPNPLPNPQLSDVSDGADALEKAEEAVTDNGGGVKWTKARDNREQELDAMMSQLLTYVNYVANGNSEIILSAAMELKKAPVRKKVAVVKQTA